MVPKVCKWPILFMLPLCDHHPLCTQCAVLLNLVAPVNIYPFMRPKVQGCSATKSVISKVSNK